VDLAALEEALRKAEAMGDRDAIRELVRQLESEELPPQHAGELQRQHIRGAPPDQYSIVFAPADEPPPTYPGDLPWLGSTKTALMDSGAAGPVIVHWVCAEADEALERVIAQSLAAGWEEAPGFRFPTASGTRVRILERGGVVRQLVAIRKGEHGMVQMTQATRRPPPGTAESAPRAG